MEKQVEQTSQDPVPQIAGEQSTEGFDSQSLTEHLRDLRSCLVVSMAAIFAGFAGSYVYIKPIGNWFFKPLIDVLPEGSSLIFTSYQEGFFFI